MFSICNCFSNCSFEVQKWLTKQPEVKEETLTDWLLYNLSERLPIVKYKQFSRSEEGKKTGADWEWWFVFSEKTSFAARVQAKKLKPLQDCYPGIAYTSNNKLQIDRLIEDSEKDKMASLYVFYSQVGSSITKCGLNQKGQGIFIGDAKQLRNEFILKARKKLLAADVIKLTNPMTCLFCCPLIYGAENIEGGFNRYVHRYLSALSDETNQIDISEKIGFRETPHYILQLLVMEEIPDWWEGEFRQYTENAKAIVLFDLRGFKTIGVDFK